MLPWIPPLLPNSGTSPSPLTRSSHSTGPRFQRCVTLFYSTCSTNFCMLTKLCVVLPAAINICNPVGTHQYRYFNSSLISWCCVWFSLLLHNCLQGKIAGSLWQDLSHAKVWKVTFKRWSMLCVKFIQTTNVCITFYCIGIYLICLLLIDYSTCICINEKRIQQGAQMEIIIMFWCERLVLCKVCLDNLSYAHSRCVPSSLEEYQRKRDTVD